MLLTPAPCQKPIAERRIVAKITPIITDGGDDFYWERGKGIAWLTPEERTK